jgi:glutamate dehydrogenase (NADP+)
MCQNSARMPWSSYEVDRKLHDIMITIHKNVCAAAAEYGAPDNYVIGANIAGFVKVADAMLDQGLV